MTLVPQVEALEVLAAEANQAAALIRTKVEDTFQSMMALGRVLYRARQAEPNDQRYGEWLQSHQYFGFERDWTRKLQAAARAEAEGEQVNSAEYTALSPSDRIKALAKAAPNIRTPKTLSKPKLGVQGVSHPARFSDPILEALDEELPTSGVILDPFAGTGKIHELATDTRRTIGVEIEPEWAELHPDTVVGNALDLEASGIAPGSVDAIATSPTYGNRLADKHKAADPQSRRSYTHDLGRPLSADNSGGMQWGDEYRRFHLDAYAEMFKALKPGGLVEVNVSDHIRDGEPQGVHLFHAGALMAVGFEWVKARVISTQRLRQGENADKRVDGEWLVVVRRP